jgi:hypothetical protein
MPPNQSYKQSLSGKSKTEYLKQFSALKTERQDHFSIWQDLANYISPERGKFLNSGKKKTTLTSKKILDSTATLAVRTLSSGMMAGISSPAQNWFKLEPAQKELEKDPIILAWIKDIEKSMMNVFARSNIYNVLHNLYSELVVFGTAAMIIDTDDEDTLRAYPLAAGEYALASSSKGQVNTLYREFTLSIDQASEKFGIEKLSKDTQQKLAEGNGSTALSFIQVIEPNPKFTKDQNNPFNKAYQSIIFEKDSDEKEGFTSLSGYDEFPVMCPRWSLSGGDTYGHSPAMEALPDIKQLQHEQRKKAQAIDKKVSPPLQAPSSMKHSAVNGLPGGVTFYDETRQQSGIRPTYDVNLPLSELIADIDDVQKRIERIFYADLFLMLSGKHSKNMTAREVEERHEEKMLMLGPVLERLHNELLDPLIKRSFAIIKRAGFLPPPPEGHEGTEIKVEYVSMMAQAQRTLDLVKLERLMEFVAKAQAINPMQTINIDNAAMIYRAAQLIGLNAELYIDETSQLDVENIQNGLSSVADMLAPLNNTPQPTSILNTV